MVIPCIIRVCTNTVHRRPRGVTFHGFPKNPGTREKWISASKSIQYHPEKGKGAFICSEHFMLEDFYPLTESGLRKLREDAVPSIFLSKEEKMSNSPDVNDKEEKEEEKEDGWLSDKVLVSEVDKTPLNAGGASINKERPANENDKASPMLAHQEEAGNEECNRASEDGHVEGQPFNNDSSASATGGEHMTETGHQEKPFQCKFCNKVFRYKDSLRKHTRIHTRERKFVCGICNEGFKENFILVEHIRIHSGETPFQCDKCSIQFLTESDFYQHIISKEHNEEIMNTLQCEFCRKIFSRKVDLDVHVGSVHIRLERYKCRICNKAFFTRSKLKFHMIKHSGETPFQCNICSRRFNSRCNMKRHLQTHGDKSFQCEFCSKMFAQRQTLLDHIQMHIGKRFECEHCGKKYTQKLMLIAHIRKHTGETPYECEFCKKSFSQKLRLKVHLKAHTRKSSYKSFYKSSYKSNKCTICYKILSNQGNLKRHLLVHSGKRPFKCEHCSKSFNQKTILITHIRVHTGEKPFQCDNCGRCFSDHSTLIRHRRTHQ